MEKERALTEEEVQRLETEYRARESYGASTTTAAPGAPIDQVRAGMQEVEAVRAARAAFVHGASTSSGEYKPSRAAHTKRLSTSA